MLEQEGATFQRVQPESLEHSECYVTIKIKVLLTSAASTCDRTNLLSQQSE